MNDQDIELIKLAVLGQEADEWWNSDLGQYVLERSLRESKSLTTKLKFHDPFDTEGIQKLQFDIQVAEKALVWIGQAIQEGRQAFQSLERQQELDEQSG